MTVGDFVRQGEAEFRLLLEQMPAIVWSTDLNLRLTSSLGSGLAMLNLRPGQVVGMTLTEYFGNDDPAFPPLAAHHQALQGQAVEFDLEWGGRSYRTRVEPLRDGKGIIIGTVAIATDVTRSKQDAAALKAATDELQEARRMEALGHLAGGIAHDFNNLLTAILGYSDVLQRSLSAADERRKDVDQILNAAHRATALTQQLLAMSRRQLLSPRILDLGAVISGIEAMLRRLVAPKIELVVKNTPGLGRVSADQGQIEQAIINLVINARDRMPGGGKLIIETSNAEGAYVAVGISDTGPALDAAARDRVFEPFAPGHADAAPGLGLASVYGMVRQSLGRITVDSTPGRGATFRILLPEVMGENTPAPLPVAMPSAPEQPGMQTILLVDDEPAVRRLACDALAADGYRVLEAASVQVALEIGDEFPGPIDLLLTDVVMPELTGPQLAARLAARRPEMRILYMSGFADEEIVRRGVLAAGQSLVAKPFTMLRLAHEVRRALKG